MRICAYDTYVNVKITCKTLVCYDGKLERHSVERITSDKGRYQTAQLCVFVVLDLELLQLTQS